MIFRFTVSGNHESRVGNPVPYTRSTAKQARARLGKQLIRYHNYCQHVRNAMISAVATDQNFRQDKAVNVAKQIHLLGKGEKSTIFSAEKKEWLQLHLIYFVHNIRGDAQNIGKGIMDAIHGEDKYIMDANLYTFDKKNPRVKVIITNEVEVFLAEQTKFFKEITNDHKN